MAWTALTPSQFAWKIPVPSAASADGGQDFQYAVRSIGALTCSTTGPFLMTNSTLSEGMP